MPIKGVVHMRMKRVTSRKKPMLWTDPPSNSCPFQQWRYLETRMTRIERNMQAVFQHIGLQPPLMESDDEAGASKSWLDLDATMVRELNARIAHIGRHIETLFEHTGFKPPPSP